MAISKTVTIDIELERPNDLVLVHAVQGEYYSRQVIANLKDGGVDYTIPSEAVALIRYRKPDGKVGFYDFDPAGNRIVNIQSNNKSVKFTIAEDMCSVPGRVVAHIDLYSKTSGNRLSAFYFHVDVEKAATDPEIYVVSNAGGVQDLIKDILGNVYTPGDSTTGAVIDPTLTIPNAVGDAKAMGDVVLVQPEEPTETTNKIWIDSDSYEDGVEVPTVEELNAVASKGNTSAMELENLKNFSSLVTASFDSKKNVDTDFVIHAGEKYYARINDSSASLTGHYFNVIFGYEDGASGTYFTLYPGQTKSAVSTLDSHLRIYNNTTYIGDIEFQVWSEIEQKIYDLQNSDSINMKKYPKMILSEASLSEVTGGTNNANDFPVNRYFYVANSVPDFENMASKNGRKDGYYVTLASTSSVPHSGDMQIFFGRYGYLASRVNANGIWGTWIDYSQSRNNEYYVGPSRQNTSITSLFLDLKNDFSNKTIYIDPGTYDLYAEYREEEGLGRIPSVPPDSDTSYYPSTQYIPYNVNIPPNTKLIGIGDVTLLWDPDPDDLTTNEAETLSPINMTDGDVEIHNVSIVCGSGRYAIHDDPHNTNLRCRHIFKNMTVTRINVAKGKYPCYAAGYSDGGYYEFTNCVFDNQHDNQLSVLNYCVGGHEGASTHMENVLETPMIIFNSCVFNSKGTNSLRFTTLNQNEGASQRIPVYINGCYIQKRIYLKQQHAESKQFYDIQVLNSGNPEIVADISVNPYPPKIYPPV